MSADIRITVSEDGRRAAIRLPFAEGVADIMKHAGARWRRSAGVWVMPADRLGDLGCRLGHLSDLITRQQGPGTPQVMLTTTATRLRAYTMLTQKNGG